MITLARSLDLSGSRFSPVESRYACIDHETCNTVLLEEIEGIIQVRVNLGMVQCRDDEVDTVVFPKKPSILQLQELAYNILRSMRQ